MSTKRISLIVFAAGGAVAGIAGVIEMLGNVQRFGPLLSNNLGYTGVVVAVLAGGLGPQLLAMALVFAAIAVAGNVLSITGAPSELVFAMYGLTLITAAVGQGIRHVQDRPSGARSGRRRRRPPAWRARDERRDHHPRRSPRRSSRRRRC